MGREKAIFISTHELKTIRAILNFGIYLFFSQNKNYIIKCHFKLTYNANAAKTHWQLRYKIDLFMVCDVECASVITINNDSHQSSPISISAGSGLDASVIRIMNAASDRF